MATDEITLDFTFGLAVLAAVKGLLPMPRPRLARPVHDQTNVKDTDTIISSHKV